VLVVLSAGAAESSPRGYGPGARLSASEETVTTVGAVIGGGEEKSA
jgi:hypothetical protein